MAILTPQAFVLPVGGVEANPRIPRVLPPIKLVVGVLSLVIVVRLPIIHRVRAASVLAAEAGRRAVLQVVQPHGQSTAVFQRSGRMDQSIGQQLPALLDVLVVLDGVRQDLGQQLHILYFRVEVSWLQQRQVS